MVVMVTESEGRENMRDFNLACNWSLGGAVVALNWKLRYSGVKSSPGNNFPLKQ